MNYTMWVVNYSLIIEAETGQAAVDIARDHLRDLGDLSRNCYEVKPYKPPPPGRVQEVKD